MLKVTGESGAKRLEDLIAEGAFVSLRMSLLIVDLYRAGVISLSLFCQFISSFRFSASKMPIEEHDRERCRISYACTLPQCDAFWCAFIMVYFILSLKGCFFAVVGFSSDGRFKEVVLRDAWNRMAPGSLQAEGSRSADIWMASAIVNVYVVRVARC